MGDEPEVGWVIEAAGPTYWNGKELASWSFSEKHNDALRFAREVDATIVWARLLPDDVRRLTRVRQHLWCAAAAPPAPAPQGKPCPECGGRGKKEGYFADDSYGRIYDCPRCQPAPPATRPST